VDIARVERKPGAARFERGLLGRKSALPFRREREVKRSDQAKGFVVLPKRWIVERTIAWLNRCRRLAKDFENLSRNACPHTARAIPELSFPKGAV
jgi:transposase